MKLILLTLVLIISCTGQQMNMGECIQKPDKPIVWKIESIGSEDLTLSNQTDKSALDKIVKRDNSWSKVDCP